MPAPDTTAGEITALGGTLIRWGRDTWAWKDHTPEPHVQDMLLAWHYNFRVTTFGDGQYVEVPVRLARTEPDLAWVLKGGYRTRLSGDHAGQLVLHPDGRMTRAYADPATGETTGARVIPQVYLVPAEDFDVRPPCGVIWDDAYHHEILAKAAALGWRPPPNEPRTTNTPPQ